MSASLLCNLPTNVGELAMQFADECQRVCSAICLRMSASLLCNLPMNLRDFALQSADECRRICSAICRRMSASLLCNLPTNVGEFALQSADECDYEGIKAIKIQENHNKKKISPIEETKKFSLQKFTQGAR